MLDAEGNKVKPLETESGYWRIDKDRKVEVVMVRDQGVVEVWYGELADQKPQIDLATDAVARTAAAGPYSGGKRLYGYVKSDLMWVGEKPTPEVELRPYMSAHLKKVVAPERGGRDGPQPRRTCPTTASPSSSSRPSRPVPGPVLRAVPKPSPASRPTLAVW